MAGEHLCLVALLQHYGVEAGLQLLHLYFVVPAAHRLCCSDMALLIEHIHGRSLQGQLAECKLTVFQVDGSMEKWFVHRCGRVDSDFFRD